MLKPQLIIIFWFYFFTDYLEILQNLVKDWILIEIEHRVSKKASNEFWRLSNTMFHQMYIAKGNRGRNIPQISHLREKLYKDYVPPVHMDLGYQPKYTGDVTVLNDVSSIPVSKFPPSQYRKSYEIAYVDVSIPLSLSYHIHIFFLKSLYNG